jgi:hypothetical protein
LMVALHVTAIRTSPQAKRDVDHASRELGTALAIPRFNATKPPAAPPSTFSTCATR